MGYNKSGTTKDVRGSPEVMEMNVDILSMGVNIDSAQPNNSSNHGYYTLHTEIIYQFFVEKEISLLPDSRFIPSRSNGSNQSLRKWSRKTFF